MIRRNPTLVPMSDYDVQDIRDMLAKQKTDALHTQQFVLRMKRLAEKPTMQKEDLEMMEYFKEQYNALAARHEKARRLGLPVGPLPGGIRNV
jgi:hypothetical protein